VLITLTGVTVGGAPVLLTTNTDASGYYTFTGLAPGIYTLTEQQPPQWLDDLDTLGSSGGTLGNDVIGGIALPPNTPATGYDFGEQGVRERRFSGASAPGDKDVQPLCNARTKPIRCRGAHDSCADIVLEQKHRDGGLADGKGGSRHHRWQEAFEPFSAFRQLR
jgi:hypothetical protein